MKNILVLLLLISSFQINAQSRGVLLKNGIIHTGDGRIYPNGVIFFQNGIITRVDSFDDNRSYKDSRIIDLQGKHVYPGLIAANTIVGLNEIDAVRATRDFSETGIFNPNVRTAVAYNTDSKIIPTLITNGILFAQTVPVGGLISGSSSIMKFSGDNWQNSLYKADGGIHLNWPVMYRSTGWWAEPGDIIKTNNDKDLQALENFFDAAKNYSLIQKPDQINLRFEAMKKLFSGQAKLFIHVNYVKEIISAVMFCRKYKIKAVLVGAEDAWRVPELLTENDIPVIIHSLHRLPSKNNDDVNAPYSLPALLKKQGVKFCISMGGSWEVRNLPFIAGTAAAFGLSREDALRSVTSDAAEILGIYQRTGSLSVGKDANIIISSGDILDMKSNIIQFAFIQGIELKLENHQTELYQKYK